MGFGNKGSYTNVYFVFTLFAVSAVTYCTKTKHSEIRKAEITNDTLYEYETILNKQYKLVTVQCFYRDSFDLSKITCNLSYFDSANSDPMLIVEKRHAKAFLTGVFESVKRQFRYYNCKIEFKSRVVEHKPKAYAWQKRKNSNYLEKS